MEVIHFQEVHFWHVVVPTGATHIPTEKVALLSPEEQARLWRFVFQRDRRRYLMTRLLVRRVLSRYAPIAPVDWIFERNEYGRPRIANDGLAYRLNFNVTHSEGLILVAITRNRTVGVDAEKFVTGAPLEVADDFFSSSEVQALHSLPELDKSRRFWELWTLKESYIKARGMGLSIPLDCFSFDFLDETLVKLRFDEGLDDCSTRWSFFQFNINSTHLISLCLENPDGSSVQFVSRRMADCDTATTAPMQLERRSEPF